MFTRNALVELPEWLKGPLRPIRAVVQQTAYRGQGRYCPVCGRTSRAFAPFGTVPRADAHCVYCGALERHRFLWLFLQQHTNLFDGNPRSMLHVAPEQCFEPRFRSALGDGYLTADLFDPRCMVRMDVTDIQYPDQSFDVIYCSHVLEHVLDDRKAMREFHRVLRPAGWAILLVPITVDRTYEDPALVTPEERLRAFGQKDHVRRYGRDYVERLVEAGFHVRTVEVSDVDLEPYDAVKLGLSSGTGEIFYCTRA